MIHIGNIEINEEASSFAEIPKIIHQTWKSKIIPEAYLNFQKSWHKHLPNWEYRLWTDEENRAFLAANYDWFLPIYDAYPKAIMRVDAIRYFWMYHYGGVYVDLDFEALKSIEPLLANPKIVIGLEPEKHLEKVTVQQKGFHHILCNAFLASIPKAPFWEFVILQLIKSHKNQDPLEATGPLFLTRAYDLFKDKKSITLLPSALLYPIDEDTGYENLKNKSSSTLSPHDDAYAIHHWSGTWWREEASDEQMSQRKLSYLNFFAALELPNTDQPFAQNSWCRILQNGRLYQQHAINLQKVSATLISQPEPLPLVSCLMVTKNRFAMAQKSIDCFLSQTYPNRELIIVDDGNDTQLKDWVKDLNENRIRFFHLQDEGKNLGVLRNLSRQYAKGEYIAQWDDDDFSHPNRLLFQMTLIQTYELDGCTLQREQLWFPAKQKLGYSGRRLWEGSMIGKASKLPLYLAKKRGEETEAITYLGLNEKVALLDFPELYTYCFHGENTFDEPHFERLWQAGSYQFKDSEYEESVQLWNT